MGTGSTFAPSGQTVLVDNTARQIASGNNMSSQGYRVRNLSSSVQYFTHGTSNTITSAGAPSAGSPVSNTIGMLGSSVETFAGLGPFMIASSATGFEVTPGDGI
jgi:hypothetical protein